MNKIFSTEIDQILSVGIPLNHLGVNNWGLSKNQSLEALEKFLLGDIAVLGGDVLENKDGQIQHNYDNWYCERLPDETEESFIRRSIEVAKHYIQSYKSQNIDNIFFVIVPDKESDRD